MGIVMKILVILIIVVLIAIFLFKLPDIRFEIRWRAEERRILKAHKLSKKKESALKKRRKTTKKIKQKYFCKRCNSKLVTKRRFGGGMIVGAEQYEEHKTAVAQEIAERTKKAAYRCRQCGTIECRRCAEQFPCVKCGSRVFDAFFTE